MSNYNTGNPVSSGSDDTPRRRRRTTDTPATVPVRQSYAAASPAPRPVQPEEYYQARPMGYSRPQSAAHGQNSSGGYSRRFAEPASQPAPQPRPRETYNRPPQTPAIKKSEPKPALLRIHLFSVLACLCALGILGVYLFYPLSYTEGLSTTILQLITGNTGGVSALIALLILPLYTLVMALTAFLKTKSVAVILAAEPIGIFFLMFAGCCLIGNAMMQQYGSMVQSWSVLLTNTTPLYICAGLFICYSLFLWIEHRIYVSWKKKNA